MCPLLNPGKSDSTCDSVRYSIYPPLIIMFCDDRCKGECLCSMTGRKGAVSAKWLKFVCSLVILRAAPACDDFKRCCNYSCTDKTGGKCIHSNCFCRVKGKFSPGLCVPV